MSHRIADSTGDWKFRKSLGFISLILYILLIDTGALEINITTII